MLNHQHSGGSSTRNNRTYYVRPESSYVSSSNQTASMNRSIDLGNQNQYSNQKQKPSGNTIYSISQYARNKKNQSHQNSQSSSVNKETYMTIDDAKDSERQGRNQNKNDSEKNGNQNSTLDYYTSSSNNKREMSPASRFEMLASKKYGRQYVPASTTNREKNNLSNSIQLAPNSQNRDS